MKPRLGLALALALLPPSILAGPGEGGAVPDWAELIRDLEDPDPDVQDRSFARLERLGPAAVPTLIAALGSGRFLLRANAAAVLGRLGPIAGRAVPALAQALEEEERDFRLAASRALANMAAEAATIRGAIVRRLKDPAPCIRAASALTLGRMGRPAGATAAALSEALGDESRVVRVNAAWALSRIGPEGAPYLVRAIDSGDPWVRDEARRGLEALGTPQPRARSIRRASRPGP